MPGRGEPQTGKAIPRVAARYRDHVEPVLVTGASGTVGRLVAEALRTRGAVVRAGVRRINEVEPDLLPVELDFLRPETFPAAVAGSGAMFLLRPPAISKVGPTLNALVDCAVQAGVRRVVFLSVIGAGRNPLVPHHRVERHLERAALAHTFLRPGFFAQNFEDAYRLDILEDDRILVPAGSGRIAFVDVRDIAELAALALTNPVHHAGRAYDLTGPAALAFDEAASQLSRILRRTIRYEPASVGAYARHLRARGMPSAQIAVQAVLHLGLRFDQAERVDPSLGALIGRPPHSLQSYFEAEAPLGTWGTIA